MCVCVCACLRVCVCVCVFCFRTLAVIFVTNAATAFVDLLEFHTSCRLTHDLHCFGLDTRKEQLDHVVVFNIFVSVGINHCFFLPTSRTRWKRRVEERGM